MYYFSLYAALGVLLITVLAMNVSRVRLQERIGNGDGGNKKLKKAIRAHMNTLEHILPYALLLFALTGLGLEQEYMAILALGFIVVRCMHSYSMLWSVFRLRQLSAALTYVFELVACLTILFFLFK